MCSSDLQGSIHVDSSPGKGSTFVVTLPFERALDHPGLSLPALNGVTCIIVEDTDFSATDLRTFLEPVGARVMIVPDMPSAMRAITQAADTVVIVRKAVDDDLAPAAGRHAPQASSPNVRQVLIRHGRRRSGRLLDASTVLLDVDLLHRLPFMRAIAVAAGKGGKEMLDSSSADPSPAPSQTGLKDQFIHQFILVAEDDPVNRKVIQRQLALLGFDADLAINGLEALDLWRKGR